ncbi:Condensin complex subunit [Physocladia obscura]|uniref:Condensin complex subunit 1 n=1 Tax=Physocladia obscura TaxID=109957 RepID=A0AAD5X8J4_9FUNG|nr:Condensin complex subunit [Physocladia obscura]
MAVPNAETFSLHVRLLELQEDPQAAFDGETLLAESSPGDVALLLDDIVGSLVEGPENVLSEFVFDGIRSFCKYWEILDATVMNKLIDIIVERLNAFISTTADDLKQSDATQPTNFDSLHKPIIETFAFLIHWLIESAESRAKQDKAKGAAKKLSDPSTKGKKKGAKPKVDSDGWHWESQKQIILETIGSLLKLEIQRIIISASERDTFISMITKSVCLILEDTDAAKSSGVKNAAFVILGLAAKKFDSGPTKAVQTRIIHLIKEDHLAESIADFLKKMADGLEFPELTDGILRDAKDWQFTDDDSKHSKSFAKFIIKLSETMSERVLKNMVSLQTQIDSDAYPVRNAMLEVFMNLIHRQLSTNPSEAAFSQMLSFYNILEERFADKNSFVRSKVLQVLFKLADRRDIGITDIPLERWKPIVNLTISRLRDKASVVRKNAIKLLSKFIESSPFLAIESDKGQMSLKHFQKKKAELKALLKEKFPDNYGEDPEEQDDDDDEENSGENPKTTISVENNETSEPKAVNLNELISLRKFLKYYSDGVRFLKQMKTAMPILCELLSSNTKTEVIECMKFFSIAYKYEMDLAKDGTRKMIHKIWEKDASGSDDEGSIRDNLLRCYEIIYMSPMPDSIRSKHEIIANNLIGLIQEMNLAEITSLEQVLGSMLQKKMIPEGVIDVLWSVFASRRKESLPGRRRGALAILSMFGKVKKSIIFAHKDALLACGLGEQAQKDLLLAKYACVALQQLGIVKKQKGLIPEAPARLPMNDPIFTRLCQLMLIPTKSYNWFGFAEQAINTIYFLSEHPDSLCGHILQIYADRIFFEDGSVDQVAESFQIALNLEKNSEVPEIALAAEDLNDIKAQTVVVGGSSEPNGNMRDAFELSKLCFLIGHIGIRQIAHLEAIEQEWKRRKSAKEATSLAAKNSSMADELDQVTGSAEDEFADAIGYIREIELLYGQNSLLAALAPIISNICSSNISFKAPILQVMAVLALCKLMCISSKFCEDNLQLLFTILEKSTNPIIRSNIIIGLGDMAVSFNSLIDQNISYLYNRLTDSDGTVKKNTLMVLTHLILNGMVKVKGQISEMAKCLEDEDGRISDLAKLFFTELSMKDNAIYNNLPDIISNLSAKDIGVSEEEFRNIMKFLFDFLKKDKQNENIIEKLCLRFKNAEDPRLWRDVSFCISLVTFSSEKSVKKLMEALPLYADKLHEPLVYKYIHDVILKAKKLPKLESKSMLDDFEEKLVKLHEKCLENEESIATAAGISSQKKSNEFNIQLDETAELEESLNRLNLVKQEHKEKPAAIAISIKKEFKSKKSKVVPKKKKVVESSDDDDIEESAQLTQQVVDAELSEEELPLVKKSRNSRRK